MRDRSASWREFKLADVIDVKHGFAFKGEFFSEEPTANVLLTPGNFQIGGGFKADKLKYYQGEYPEEYVLNEDDIIITMTDLSKKGDTLGYPAKVPSSNGTRYLHNQRLGLVEFKSDQIDKEFLYWLLRTINYQKFIVNSASGSTVKHTSPSRIREYDFLAPGPLKEQRAIAKILSDLDEKIELNHQMNKTLESIAQAIFQRWFIDFEFPNEKGEPYKSSGGKMADSELNEIPDGWQIGKLGNFAEILNGFAFKSEDFVSAGIFLLRTRNFTEDGYIMRDDTACLPDSFYDDYKGFRLRKFDVLLVMVGAGVGKMAMVQSSVLPALQNQNMWNFRSKDGSGQIFLNYLVKKIVQENIGSASGSARDFFRKDYFRDIDFILPNKDVLKKYNEQLQPLFSQLDKNLAEIGILSKIRDSLLPKLMSGEMRVKDNPVVASE